MQLPPTNNAAHLYAFKKGYRLAMQGKPISQIPSQIQDDEQMQQYFQMGWQQFQEQAHTGRKIEQIPPWRGRIAWIIMTIIAGLGTAALMIQKMTQTQTPPTNPHLSQPNEPLHLETTKSANPNSKLPPPPQEKTEANTKTPTEKTPQNTQTSAKIPSPALAETAPELSLRLIETPSLTTEKTPPPPIKQTPPTEPTEPLALLTPEARTDLIHLKQQAQPKTIKLQPLIKSPIQIQQAVLTEKVQNRQPISPLNTPIPKYIRKVTFFTHILNAKDQTIYHRWLYQGQLMAEIPLTITSATFRTWSSKNLTSAWAGEWIIEVLDQQKNPIYRYRFHYITPNNPPNP